MEDISKLISKTKEQTKECKDKISNPTNDKKDV